MILRYERSQIMNLAMKTHKQYQEELDKILFLPDYIQSLIDEAKTGNKKFQGWNTKYEEEYPRTIRVAPSVGEMVDAVARIDDKLKMIDKSDLTLAEQFEERKNLIRSVIKPREVFTIEERPDIWWGDTLKGINMRPGLVNNDITKNIPFQVGGTRSHLKAVGDTGQGKSVIMNAIIVGLLIEYPPWELNIMLNDGKMQEYAIYAGAYKCPQIRNIAITMSSTYYESVYSFFNNEMQALNRLYAMVKVKSLQALRDYLDMAIPAQLMPHDEYAQLQINATSREWMSQNKHMASIAMLGRSTRYHLFPTSQNLSGELEKDTDNQFQIGLAVGTDEDNSDNTIGNPRAKDLLKRVGYCIVNTNRKQGDATENVMYKVPFLNDKTDEEKMMFQELLKKVTDVSKELGIAQEPSVYNEKSQTLFTDFNRHVNLVSDKDSKMPKGEGENTLALMTLGDGTRYTGEPEVVEYFKWNYERGSNLFIHAVTIDQIKYLARLVGRNLKEQGVEATHFMFIDNMETFENDYTENYRRDLTGELDITPRLNAVEQRDIVIKFNLVQRELGEEPDFLSFVEFQISRGNTELNDVYLKYNDLNSYDYDRLSLILDEAEDTNASSVGDNSYDDIYSWAKDNTKHLIHLFKYRDMYDSVMQHKTGKYLTPKDLPVMMHWFFEPQLNEGLSTRSGTSTDFLKFLNMGPSVGVFSIVIMSDVREQKQLIQTCKHLLTGEPSISMERTNLVDFTDLTGIVCKYTVCEGDGTGDRYFKRYLTT